MKYFIFRNYTIENLFSHIDAQYSIYDDISCDKAADIYIWFYALPVKAKINHLAQEIDSYLQRINIVLSNIQPGKSIYIFTLEKIFNYQWRNSDSDLNKAIMDFNREIYYLAEKNNNVKIIDFSDFIRICKNKDLINWKYYYLSKMLINPELVKDFQNWFNKKVDAINLKRKKCIVLDLDNTLWDGILGEDGPHGIGVGDDYPGSAFKDLQEGLLEISKNGVILAVCSKNNESDVLDLWEKNPFLILKKNHFSAYKINWKNKSDNIVEIAADLNIGLDSMVFIDDNPAERELVRTTLPEVAVPDFPLQPYKLTSFLKDIYEDYFQVYSLTKEDQDKTRQYKDQFKRLEHKKSHIDLEGYLISLNMELKVQFVNEYNISRVAQLTQKTNQFNLTTRRYQVDDIRRFIHEKQLVACLSVKDKFGDNGITSVCIIKLDYDNKRAVVDTYLMSCRILGRTIEDAFIVLLLNYLKDQGIETVEAMFLATNKNEQVKTFFDQVGFDIVQHSEDMKHYVLKLDGKKKIREYFKIEEIYS
ncbi:MAG: HAD-IIIC family phosphatase [bacterium]|nr:HAD-IIIC family phosphatase [bacterium]